MESTLAAAHADSSPSPCRCSIWRYAILVVLGVECVADLASRLTYTVPIMRHLEQLQLDKNLLAPAMYMDGSALGGVVQLEIAPNMRAILIDWLVEVHADFHLAPTSLHLAVNLLE